jgi:hypothetical protein
MDATDMALSSSDGAGVDGLIWGNLMRCLILSLAIISGFQVLPGHANQIADGRLVARATTVVDTLDIYGGPGALEGKFQTAGGLPDVQDWTTSDGTATEPDSWRISPYNAANLDPGVPDNNAWWCGQMFPACPNDSIGGYGNSWNTSLGWRGTVSDPALPALITVTGILNNDTEPGYDFTRLNFATAENQFHDVMELDGKSSGQIFSEAFTYAPGDYLDELGEVMVRFTFQSDGGWSDEDCNWATSGAFQVDNLQVTISQTGYPDLVGPVETCETGDTVQWEMIPNKGYGNFAQLWTNLQDEDPLVDNFSAQWAFIDDGVIEPGTGGTTCRLGTGCYGPDSLVVDIWGGLQGSIQPGLRNHVTSPPIEIPIASGVPDLSGPPVLVVSELTVSVDAYFHSDPACGPLMALGFDILSTADQSGATGWTSSTSAILTMPSGPEYRRVSITFPVESLVPNAYLAKIQISAIDMRTAWCWSDLYSTPAPYFDNVRLQAGMVNSASAVPELRPDDLRVRVHPNPFNPLTTISFTLDRRQRVGVFVYDLKGRRVFELADREFTAGDHSLQWRGRNSAGRAVPSGQYFFRVEAGGEVQIKKALLLK